MKCNTVTSQPSGRKVFFDVFSILVILNLPALCWGWDENRWQLHQQFLSRPGQRNHTPERGRFVFSVCNLSSVHIFPLGFTGRRANVFKVKCCFPVLQTSSRIFISSCFSLDEYISITFSVKSIKTPTSSSRVLWE